MIEDFALLLDTIAQQESLLQFDAFTNDMAIEVGLSMVNAATTEQLPITIDINRNGHQLFHAAMPGTSADNDAWIQRKNRVVNHFNHSSYFMGIQYKSKGKTIQETSLLDPSEYAAHGGAFPIIIRNVGVIGTITVSGLPQAEDHAFVVRMLARYLSIDLPA